MVKVASLTCVQLVKTTGNQAVAHKDTIVQSIIQGDSQADVQSVAQPATILQPKVKPEARSCMTSDFLFAMMSMKSKLTWRHSNRNGTDYMICTVAEPQKKLPVFKPGKWSLLQDSRVYLYGHDAKSMKNFTLDSLDRL